MTVQIAGISKNLLAFNPFGQLNQPSMSPARSLLKIVQGSGRRMKKFSPKPPLIGQDFMNCPWNPRQWTTTNVSHGGLQSLELLKGNTTFFSTAANECLVRRTRFARGV